MNQERIFRIGTAAACEIIVPDGIPSNVVWAHLTISEDGMHLLTIVERGIVCCVNGNAVSQQYWVNDDDVIEIEGRILNWDYFRGDSNDPFKVNTRKVFSKKILLIFSAALIAIGAILFAVLRHKPEPPHIPTASELFQNACNMTTSIDPGEVKSGYDQIEKLAIDSLYTPAVLKHYETVLVSKDTIKWGAAYRSMLQLSKDISNSEAIYECALCMSYISPKLSLPEVGRYDFVVEKDYEEANRLFDIVIHNVPTDYKAPFWEIINLITLLNGKSLSESDSDKLEDLYTRLDENLALSTDELANQYKIETERVIKTILQNWQIIN